MISPLSITNSSMYYLNKTPQQNRTASEQTTTVGREQTAATADAGQSVLNRILTVTGKTNAADDTLRTKSDQPEVEECQTCKRRKYQDGSDDPGVSFKTPTSVDPDSAASAVRGHEQEHVTREQAKAEREGREVVSQSVTYRTAICPECGRVYVSGGETRTVTRADTDSPTDEEPSEQYARNGFDVRV